MKSDAEFPTPKLSERFHIKHLHFHQNRGCHRSVRLQGLFCGVLFGLFLVLNGIRIGLGDTHSMFPLGGKLMRVQNPSDEPDSHLVTVCCQHPIPSSLLRINANPLLAANSNSLSFNLSFFSLISLSLPHAHVLTLFFSSPSFSPSLIFIPLLTHAR